MNFLLTGATGFLGRRITQVINDKPEINLTVAVRRCVDISHTRVVEVKGIDKYTDWSVALTDQQVVIHAAARAHIMNDDELDSLAEYRRVNVEGTLSLAQQAVKAGVKRFIFISTIKVNGEATVQDQPFTAGDKAAPEDAYGISKWEAEQGLLKLANETGLEVVIIRSPLIYGPDVKGNFSSMINWIKKGVPLPLGRVSNQRSLVALDNLVDFIALCADREKSPNATNQVFLISDDENVSTPELLRKVAKAYGVKSRLLFVPVGLMTVMAKLLGKRAVADRLFGNLQVDSSKARELLGWRPIITMDEQLKKMAIWEKDK